MNLIKSHYNRVITFLCIYLTLENQTITAQCAMCRAVLDNDQNQAVAQGINDGIVYLMVLPYIFVGFVAYMCYRLYRKSYQNQNQDQNNK